MHIKHIKSFLNSDKRQLRPEIAIFYISERHVEYSGKYAKFRKLHKIFLSEAKEIPLKVSSIVQLQSYKENTLNKSASLSVTFK